jgi:hypothetical protein
MNLCHPRTQEVINTQPQCSTRRVAVGQARRRHVRATAVIRSCALACAWSRTRTGRAVTDSLADVPPLCDEIDQLDALLNMALRHHQDLTAAARATLAADAEGEPNPLYYLRDELRARGVLPIDGREQPW